MKLANFESLVRADIENSVSVKQTILGDHELISQISRLAVECRICFERGGKVILAGNGGSFADAQHISAEFTGRFVKERKSLPSITLGCNSSVMTAVGNDYGFDQVFARELSSIGNVLDLFIPISTSGNSSNLLAAIEVANKLKIKTVGLTGQSGEKWLKCVRLYEFRQLKPLGFKKPIY